MNLGKRGKVVTRPRRGRRPGIIAASLPETDREFDRAALHNRPDSITLVTETPSKGLGIIGQDSA